MSTKDPYERLARQNQNYRFKAKAKFSRRLQSHDRPVPTSERQEPADTPGEQFNTKIRPEQ